MKDTQTNKRIWVCHHKRDTPIIWPVKRWCPTNINHEISRHPIFKTKSFTGKSRANKGCNLPLTWSSTMGALRLWLGVQTQNPTWVPTSTDDFPLNTLIRLNLEGFPLPRLTTRWPGSLLYSTATVEESCCRRCRDCVAHVGWDWIPLAVTLVHARKCDIYIYMCRYIFICIFIT